MIFERVTIQDIHVMFISGRKFYGTFDPNTSEYRACVALREGDQPEAVGCSRDVIAGGLYLRVRLRGELDKITPRISGTCSSLF